MTRDISAAGGRFVEISVRSDCADRPDVAVVRLAGHLDAHTFEEATDRLGELIAEGWRRIILDLGPLKGMSSAGAGSLIGLECRLSDEGGAMVLAAPTAAVREVLELLGLDGVFVITESVDQALAALPGPAAPAAGAD
jgi:anti-anti-sigma factor